MPGVFVSRFLLFACFALLGAGAPLWAAECRPTAPLEAVTVARVIDGDTLQLAGGRRLRLIGINAPELGRVGRPGQPFARQAQAALERQLGADRRLWLQPGSEARDRHGRLLAHAFASERGDSVEAALLRAGLALQVALPPNLALADCLAAAERAARSERAGLWQAHAAPRPASALRPGDGGFQRVRGRVVTVEESRHSWWLELDGAIVVRIDKRDLVHFDRAAPQQWQGRTLVVRGWVSDRSERVAGGRKPLVMPLRHPLMLEAPLAPAGRVGL